MGPTNYSATNRLELVECLANEDNGAPTQNAREGTPRLQDRTERISGKSYHK